MINNYPYGAHFKTVCKLKNIACSLLLLFFTLGMSAQTIRYVKQGGTGDGTSWALASGSLQAMIDASASGNEIWVAAGTYQPVSGQSFSMKEGVKMYGSFAANGNPGIGDRSWTSTPAILLGNGTSVVSNQSNGLTNAALLDGFTITGGNTAENGGGVMNINSYPSIANCTFRNNNATMWGGGLYNQGAGSTLVKNSLFYSNTSSGGGGAFDNLSAATKYINTTIAGNSATQNGGGIHTYQGAAITMQNCIIWGNTAITQGRQLYLAGGTTIFSYSLTSNAAADLSGTLTANNAIYSDPLFTIAAAFDFSLGATSPAINAGNTLLFANTSSSWDLSGKDRTYGTTIDMGCYEAQPALSLRYVKTVASGTGTGSSWANASSNLQSMIDASVSGNEVWVAAGTYQPASGQSYSMKEGVKIYGGFTATGTPAFTNRNWAANITILQGNGNRVVNNDGNGLTNAAVLDGFTLTSGNTAENGGGMKNVNAYPSVINCIFRNNNGTTWGGGMYNAGNGSTLVQNSLFYSNTSSGGGGTFDNLSAGTKYINTTITGNNSTSNGGGMHTYQSAAITLQNTIIWGNTAASGGKQIYLLGGTTTFTNSITSNTAADLSGTLTASNAVYSDPLFTNAAANNYTLQPGSPATDAGSTAFFANAATSKDLAVNTRLLYNAIDIGAYENQTPPTTPPTANAQSFCGTATVASLVATGTALKWYSASTGGTELANTTSITTGMYFVSQTQNGIESTRTSVSVTVNAVPAAPTASSQIICGSGTVGNLVATGTGIQWYAASTGGTALATTANVTTGTYYASQTENGCESTRTSVSVTVNSLPLSPTTSAQVFCGSTTVANLIATGTGIQWYAALTGGTALATTASVTTGTYYASQTVNGCESTRTSVSVTVNSLPLSPTASAQAFCGSTSVANLIATGTGIQWYTASTGGTALVTTASVTTGTYYASQTVNGCESTRTSVSVTVYTIPAAPTASAQSFCGTATVASLVATGTSLKWYAASIGGTALATTTNLTTGMYYVSQTANGCESTRTLVSVTITAIPAAPVAGAQYVAPNATIAALSTSGQNIKWYTTANGGTALATTTALSATTYFASQTVNGCESPRTQVQIIALASSVLYVKKGSAGNGTSWSNALGELADALKLAKTFNDASAGTITEIWVSGGIYYPLYRGDDLGGANPVDRANSFVLVKDVKVYGGFAGTEAELQQRDLSLTANASILNGDFSNNDTYSAAGLTLSTGNTENAGHLVISAGNVGTAELNGFTIRNARSLNVSMVVNGLPIGAFGPAIFIHTSSPKIQNVIITKNTGEYGAGIYITPEIAAPVIKNAVISYNQSSRGAGIYVLGGSPEITNCTITANSAGTGGPGIYLEGGGNKTINNCIIWGSTGSGGNIFDISSSGTTIINNSIIAGSASTGGGSGNMINVDPLFTNAANGDFTLQPNSPAINTGSTALFANAATSKDIVDNPRLSYGTIDIGAYENQLDPVTPPTASAQTFCGTTTVASLVATGTNLKWYIAATGGSALANTASIATGTYYVSQTVNGYESARRSVSITVNITTAPTASSQNFCGNATVAELTATGSNKQWYTASTGGTALITTANVTTGTYYVSQTVNGCESSRTLVNVTVNTIPAAPVATSQSFCGSATVASLAATGSIIKWYTASTGGTALATSTSVTTGTYYASQTVNGCESIRASVSVTINAIPVAPTASAQVFCGSATVANIIATGTGIKWYTASTGGTALATTANVTAGTYYASQTVSGCESSRTSVSVTINVTSPPTADTQYFCGTAPVQSLVATGTNIKWYNVPIGGTPLPYNILLNTATYYASQTVNGCESSRTPVSVIGNTAPVAPPQMFGPGSTVAGLFASGENLQWYNSATGGTALPATTALSEGYYYVSQTVNGCESPRTGVQVSPVTSPILYVIKGLGGNGSSWNYAIGELADAIKIAKTLNSTVAPGTITQIWVAGGTYSPLYRADDVSTADPVDRRKTFLLVRDTKIYGGFAGNETTLAQRDFSLTANASILNGDFYDNDTFTPSGTVTGGNDENAYHVVTGKGYIGTAELDGFTIKGGNANEYIEEDTDNYYGGGIYLSGIASVLKMANLTITGNASAGSGGGIYCVDTPFALTNALISNNRAYSGGGMELTGSNSTFINCTFTANTGAIEYDGNIHNVNIISSDPIFNNCIVWGEVGLTNANPLSINSLIGMYNTVYWYNGTIVDGGNNINADPLFTNADTGDYALQITSPAVNAGSTALFANAATLKDLVGSPRVSLGNIDMGAYEKFISSPAASAQTFCGVTIVGNLVATGSGLKWYTAATGGTALATTANVTTGNYYVSQTVNGYETDRTQVSITVNTLPGAPVAGLQQVASGSTIINLYALGQNIQWYSVAAGGTALTVSEVLTEGTYYASQTVNGCEGARIQVQVVFIVYPPIVYVKQNGTGNGTSWANASGSLQAMISMPGVQEVWVAAGDYQPAINQSFSMKQGVKIYGGFPPAGTPGMAERNVHVNETKLVGNGSSVIINNGNGLTNAALLDGFTVTGGNTSENGGGMKNVNSYPSVVNCIFRNNNGTNWGGGMYNEGSGSTLVKNSLFYGNTSSGGGGIFDNLSATTKYINTTIAGNNSTQNGGGIHTYQSAAITLQNCIVWGNTAVGGKQLYLLGSMATFANSITGSTPADIYGAIAGSDFVYSDPLFTNAAANDYTIQSVSPANDGGNTAFFANAATSKDLMGNPRLYGSRIDIGAYESDILPPPIAYAQNFCGSITVAGLTATGSALQWYNVATDGIVLNATDTVTTGIYYVSQTVNGIESSRRSVNVSVNAIPAAPVAGLQEVAFGSTIINLYASGQNIKWYSVAAGGTALTSSQEITAGAYYVSQTVNGCESARTQVQVVIIVYPPIVYVKQNGTGNGTSWANASGNLQAMINITGVQEVWVAAGEYQSPYEDPFRMKEGVKIYGGFPATGTPGMADRDLYLNETNLVGNNNNVIVNWENSLTNAAVLDGFTISNGHSDMGGGIINYLVFPSINNCIFRDNTAGHGGAMFNAGEGSIAVTNCLFYNNHSLYGGGAIMDNVATNSVYTNVTFANNTTSATGGAYYQQNNVHAEFNNCIFYGNTADVNGDQISGIGYNTTVLNNSLIDLTGTNIYFELSEFTANNCIAGDPLFTNAAADDFTLQPNSPAINTGSTALFTNAATVTDLAGNPRLYGNEIDMGAYEYKPADCGITTIWDGSAWSNGIPVSYEYSAIIEGDHDSSENGEIIACSLTINSGDIVIATGDNFTIKSVVTVDNENATFTVAHNANLIQEDDVDNVGMINVIKESAPMYRLDYALWGAPVAGQTLKEFSPQTLDNRFYTYNPLSDTYSAIQSPANTGFAEGKGYLIRVANNHQDYVNSSIPALPWEGTFSGVPNNGDVDVPVTAAVIATEGSAAVKGFNAISNPYPSSINIAAFFEANQNNLASNTPIFFWRKKNEAGTSSYCSLTLAGYNANTGNAFGDSSNGVFSNPNDSENWVINPGQGFIVRATAGTVVFNNEMRVAVNNGQMFRSAQDTPDRSRLWLNLTNADGAFGQMMIAYTPTTNLGLDYGWDGQALTDGNVAIYSLGGGSKLGIQARPAFDPVDEVPMEYKVSIAGSYSISLDHFDGVFLQGQQIYLRDNLLDVVHNLESPYGFITDAGTISGRFDVIYAEPLSTDDPVFDANSIIVYKQDTAINISTGNTDMKSVAIYDTRGRLLYISDNINAAQTSITTLHTQEQMLIVQVTTVGGVKASRKIVF